MFATLTREENQTWYATELYNKLTNNVESFGDIPDERIIELKSLITARTVSKHTLVTLVELLFENNYAHAAKQVKYLLDNIKWSKKL